MVTLAVLLIVAVVGVIYFWTDYVTGGVQIVIVQDCRASKHSKGEYK